MHVFCLLLPLCWFLVRRFLWLDESKGISMSHRGYWIPFRFDAESELLFICVGQAGLSATILQNPLTVWTSVQYMSCLTLSLVSNTDVNLWNTFCRIWHIPSSCKLHFAKILDCCTLTNFLVLASVKKSNHELVDWYQDLFYSPNCGKGIWLHYPNAPVLCLLAAERQLIKEKKKVSRVRWQFCEYR